MTKKIVGISNFDHETVDDVLMASDVPEQHAQFLADQLNDHNRDPYSVYFYVVKDEDYVLYKWEP